ncbi:hypothetical protein LTR04_000858, partial [Oleoguttula sp. CCFEE 6159]
MYRQTKPDGYDLTSPRMSRSPSISSDRASTSGASSFFPIPTSVNPPPAYVALSAAAQMVIENHNAQMRDSSEDEAPQASSERNARFSENALALVNAFLDQLLYSFLSAARSTTLPALRPAVTDVLKQKLAREAIASADEELDDLLDDGDDEDEFATLQGGRDEANSWDLELVWKRTRLRIMVYTRLGEMEDEDEERYVGEEDLANGIDRPFSQSMGLVSWAAAIFLTSILEYVAEQTIAVAGQAAYMRVKRRSSPTVNYKERVVVEEHDVEKVALNSLLGRLWRTWRKGVRTPGVHTISRGTTPTQRRYSFVSPLSPRRGSFGSVASVDDFRRASEASPNHVPDVPAITHPEHILAANIPLPANPNDVNEIEVPGLAKQGDEEDSSGSRTPTAATIKRTSSLGMFPNTFNGLPTPVSSQRPTPNPSSAAREGAPLLQRRRSHSVPTSTSVSYVSSKQSLGFEAAEPMTPGIGAIPGSYPKETDRSTEPEQQIAAEEPRAVAGTEVLPVSYEELEAAAPTETTTEPKSHAEEMKSAKESSGPVKELADHPDDPVDRSEEHKQQGIAAGVLAGATTVAAATIASLFGSQDRGHLTKDSEEHHDTRKSLIGMKSAPTVTDSQVVRRASRDSAHSVRSNQSYSLGETPQVMQAEGRAVVEEVRDAGDAQVDPTAIGVARTSNMSIPAIPLPPSPMSPAFGNTRQERDAAESNLDGRLVKNARPVLAAQQGARKQS